MANTNIQNPKLTISTIKSPLTDGGFSLGNVGQEGNSKTGTLARIVGKNRISISSLIKSQETQDRKITILKNIVQNIQKNVVQNNIVQSVQKNIVEGNQNDKIGTLTILAREDGKITILKNISRNRQSNIGQKLPDSDGGNIEKSLMETNQILVQIQQELMRSSALRSKEEKSKLDRAKRGLSRAKLSAEESELEKSSQKIKKSVGEKAEQTIAPVKGIFGRIMDFLGTLALGIAGNAIFEWLKNPENMEKVKGWFNWIKENWGWAAAAIGAIALMPLIGVISGIVSTLSLLAPVLIPIAPLLLKALAIVGGIVLAYKGLEAGFNAVRNSVTGGSEYSAAHDILDQKLRDAGLDQDGKKRGSGFLGLGRREVEMSEDEKTLAADVLTKRKQLNRMRDDMRSEIKEKHSDMDKNSGLSGFSSQNEVNKFDKSKSGAEKEIRADYARRITQLVPLNIEARERGGPVNAGRPYLVGEKGPELFMPNIGGTVVNNQKTERIYQMISSRRKGRGGVNIVNLPPITNKMPPPELPPMGGQATDVPSISSVNMADPYRQLSPMLYGITV